MAYQDHLNTEPSGLTNQEIETLLPGFTRVLKKSKEFLESLNRTCNHSMSGVPPILICSKDELDPHVKWASAESTREDNGKRGYAHFQPLENTIYIFHSKILGIYCKMEMMVSFKPV